MSTKEAPNYHAFLEQLKTLSSDLYFLSESEFPFEVVYAGALPAGLDLPSFLLHQVRASSDTKIVIEDLPYFFRNHTNTSLVEESTAQSFLELQEFLINSLQDVEVYRIGERRIEVYIIGKMETGEHLGLKTIVIET